LGFANSPFGIAINPAGTRVFVAANSVVVIDTATNSIVTTITVGANPVAFGQFIAPFSAMPPRSAASVPTLFEGELVALALLLAVLGVKQMRQ
jgi:YVTN family beta-propeller protein